MNFRKPLAMVFLMLLFVHLSVADTHYQNVSKTVNSLNVSIDSRQELISIVQYLGDYFMLNNLELEYKNEVDKYFATFKDHETVKFVKKLTKQGFTYDAPPAAMLHFSNDFEVKTAFTDYLKNRAGGEKNIAEFARLMKKFAEDTEFNTFLEAQRDLYNQTVNKFAGKLTDFHGIETLESFYGQKQRSYNLVLSMLNSGNYGPRITIDGATDIYNIMSAIKTKGGSPVFQNVNRVENLVWHEFGHSFVNNLTRDNIDLVTNYEALLEPIKTSMKDQAYGSWETVVNEHVIRAVCLKFAEDKHGSGMAYHMKFNEIYSSFYYIDPLCEQIDFYMQNRDTYKTFEDFYPVLIKKAFSKAQKKDYTKKYLKSLNNTYKDVDYVVVSADEKDSVIQKNITGYVTKVKNNFFKEAPLITDREAVKKDLSKYSFLVYGTVKNNALLQHLKSKLPIQITDSAIYAHKQYALQNGRAIFNMQNPFNEEKSIVVYTAQNPEEIVDINNVHHGPTNYIIFENRKKVHEVGYFVKEDDQWICK